MRQIFVAGANEKRINKILSLPLEVYDTEMKAKCKYIITVQCGKS